MPLTGFHPTIAAWFAETLGEPTPPQVLGWPVIQSGRHTLIAAPTGTGKTFAAFLSAIDQLIRGGRDLPSETQVLYVSPLKALGNDIQKNLQRPLAEVCDRNLFLPDVRVAVRTGDTPPSERAAMKRRPPHILVTTPESLYILLTSQGGREMLANVRTCIVDEIHALARDKRGSHLSLSLERLEALAGPFQRIGLSATQKPIEEIARFLVGVDRECEIIDVGHQRELDLAIEIPSSPLSAVCSHDTWGDIYERMAALILEHRTTLVFVNTRKLAERIAARLTDVLGEDKVTCHHSSLSKERRLDAETRLKQGRLRALVATASLELGIDIGDVDLAIQIGSSRSIATFLQRVGRAGHGVGRIPRGRIFPLTIDELVESAALLRAVRRGELDPTPQPIAPMDILMQQIVSSGVTDVWDEDELFALARRAWPYRDITREQFDAAVALHTQGRWALLHRDGVNGRLRATRRARITAITSGGAIPDTADYRVELEPEGLYIGSLNEDFAIESNVGDIFQLGNTSWRVLRIEDGVVRVADAQGLPPTVPFWFGEAPGRTTELSAAIGETRETCVREADLADIAGLPAGAAEQIVDYLNEGRRVLGAVPTQRRIIAERFFDESGGMQLVLHAPFGGRINRAWGLALRKRFCRGFGFELQAAANEEAIIISLAAHHSFPLQDVFKFLHPDSAKDVLIQAMLDQPMFESRWRWNVTRSLLLERMRNGRKVPPQILRMRAEDLLAAAFPEAIACPENLPAGSLPVPMDHPIVRQTVEDCLHEAMDIDGFLALIRNIRDEKIECRAVDTPEPSVFSRSILNAAPYSFLDDAPLEERRTRAVSTRRSLDPKTMDDLGALDPDAVRRVREEAWPRPINAEEVHEALLWMGFVTDAEAHPWRSWLAALADEKRVVREGDRWFAVEAPREPKDVLRGRLEALGPVESDDPVLLQLESEGCVLRVRLDGREHWCDRRLLARIHRYTLERLRNEIRPVSAADYLRFLACWQHAHPKYRLDGPNGVATVVRQLAGFDVPAAEWEKSILPARVRDYRREWLDQLTLSGELVWGRLWGAAASSTKNAPICLLPREDLPEWLGLAAAPDETALTGPGRDLLDALRRRGPSFPLDLQRDARLVPAHHEMGLADLIGHGFLTCDSFSGLRELMTPPSKRRRRVHSVGRWSIFRAEPHAEPDIEFITRQLLQRTGILFKQVVSREKAPFAWYAMQRCLRHMELRGDVRGGRFVSGLSGEQYALPEAIEILRAVRREDDRTAVHVASADPLNLSGILTPEPRVSSTSRQTVAVA